MVQRGSFPLKVEPFNFFFNDFFSAVPIEKTTGGTSAPIPFPSTEMRRPEVPMETGSFLLKGGSACRDWEKPLKRKYVHKDWGKPYRKEGYSHSREMAP